ncbi:MAG: prolipoprotein diacylglyceryl transferase [Bacillota bacterium]
MTMFLNILTKAHDGDYEPLSNVLFEIGPVTVYLYSFMILLGVLAALLLAIREGKRLGVNPDHIIDGLIIILPLSILGARLYYVIFEWENYSDNPARILAFQEGGLAIHGGFIVAIVSAYIYTRIRKMDLWKVTDLIAPGFLIAQAFGRWGNFFNQEAHGGVVGGVESGSALLSQSEQFSFLHETLRIPEFIVNMMYINGPDGLNYYHPTFLYESIWNLMGFALILVLRRTKFMRSGDMIGVYLIWYSIGRFFIESMRTDALFIGDTGLRIAQVISVLMVLLGIAVFVLNRIVFNRKHYAKVLKENDL